MCTYFLSTKKVKIPNCKQPLNISENSFFYKQVLDFHRPSKILCRTSGTQNHRSLLNILWQIHYLLCFMYQLGSYR